MIVIFLILWRNLEVISTFTCDLDMQTAGSYTCEKNMLHLLSPILCRETWNIPTALAPRYLNLVLRGPVCPANVWSSLTVNKPHLASIYCTWHQAGHIKYQGGSEGGSKTWRTPTLEEQNWVFWLQAKTGACREAQHSTDRNALLRWSSVTLNWRLSYCRIESNSVKLFKVLRKYCRNRNLGELEGLAPDSHGEFRSPNDV